MNFGGKKEATNASLKPGINSGLKLTTFFNKIEGVGKMSGNPYTAYELEFTNGISIRQWFFLPVKSTEPSPNDAQYLKEFNERAKKKDSTHVDLTMEDWLQRKFNNAASDFNSLLNMVAYSFYPDGSDELKNAIENLLPQYDNAEAFIADLGQLYRTVEEVLAYRLQPERLGCCFR
jgi:hypothetical protein